MWKSDGHTTRYMVNGEWIEKPKIPYSDEKSAIEAARKINLSEKTIHKVMAYHCSVCGKWHVGRTKRILTLKDREHYIKADKKLKLL